MRGRPTTTLQGQHEDAAPRRQRCVGAAFGAPAAMCSPGRLLGSAGDKAAASSCRCNPASPVPRRRGFPPSPPSGSLRATTGRRSQPFSWTTMPSRLPGAWGPRWARWAASSPPAAGHRTRLRPDPSVPHPATHGCSLAANSKHAAGCTHCLQQCTAAPNHMRLLL